MDKRAEKIIAEVRKVIKGKDDVVEKILTVIFADGHILLEDVPGVGKTSMAVAFSKAMSLDYHRVQFTYDTMASDIVGFSVYNKKNDSFEYKQGAAFCNLFLADEINRTSPKTQAALLEVMEEGRVTVDGVTRKIPEPFICIATQNPTGSAGTQNLPESQLDRFMVRLTMGYPSLESQIDIVKNRQAGDPMNTVSPVISLEELLEIKQDVQKIFVSDDVIRFGIELCEATRKMDMVELGVSPRAALALIQLGKANALLKSRDYVIPEDIKSIFIDVCRHRLILKPQAKIKKETVENVLESVLDKIKAPAIV
ncbi:AAA family ATPase [Clostridium magnum]|uniref:Replication factor C small subunit n=1 Tax=Clostridium magnum DSM 2767 TaxID=1121326 RepID=A0A161YNI4_9CLOT|nr:MoxR family ATPase [Clostridium magnum]KZL92272.1 replication factor C small subunit [Clostridium magnum DSM 2767]SHH15416.1 MoxR-like ATPase [Clostridium magnum DSM 2767]